MEKPKNYVEAEQFEFGFIEDLELLPEGYSERLQFKEGTFEDLRGVDLSLHDLRSVSVEVLINSEFDTKTKWPKDGKLPEGFNPEKLLEESKNPGLGIKELHSKGINGEGVRVAIIDQKLDVNHQEYKDSLVDYLEYGTVEDEPMSMHGPAVSSLLVGKNCGVAPGAKLVYRAVPSGERNFVFFAQALNDIIESNRKLPQSEKVRVVSCSIGYMVENPEPGLDEWIDTLKKAKLEGLFVVDVSGDDVGVKFTGGGSHENKEDIESYSPWLGVDKELHKLYLEGDISKIYKKIRSEKREELSNVSDVDLKRMIMERLSEVQKTVIVPTDFRTMASSWNGEGQYMYNGKGGMSWAVPYLAGIFALALQVNPNLKAEEISKIINETSIINKKGLNIINPKGIIDRVKEGLGK